VSQAGRIIRVAGRVHGVGFRPFVWRLARSAGLHGRVRNDGAGVVVEAWGPVAALEAFMGQLRAEAPPLARIDAVTWSDLDGAPPADGFQIAPSGAGPISAEIAPDAATCADCLAEIFDTANRRHRYPFTNCTQCGPRLSIVRRVPWDRPLTAMAGFAMCAECRAEYLDPADRRFHAEPIACPACGPKLWLEDRAGPVPASNPIAETARRLRAGEIVAIKGIGSFHLACDAGSTVAVAELRRRKRRPTKPFAVMVRDLAAARHLALISDGEAEALGSRAAPIVLLRTRGTALPGIAPGLDRVGIMLPATPLHHLLMAALDGPIVLTSGNVTSAPPAADNARARADLARIADAWLMHDRQILWRLDDPVLRMDGSGPAVLRRGRGLAPEDVPLPAVFGDAPPVLAMGGDLKAAYCLLRDGRAAPSAHIGDLGDAAVFEDYRRQIAATLDLYGMAPEVIAVDMHPDYLSARWGRTLAGETPARLVPVQHHHAHLASCLAEHGLAPGAERVLGIVLDGTGSGPDGTIWGGEILLGGYVGFQRRGHLPAIAMPGGEQAARVPWRNTLAHLIAAFGPDWRTRIAGTDLAGRLDTPACGMVERMITGGVNAPPASSAGRLFDAVAAALGFEGRQDYEGQAAMRLEAMAAPHMATAEAWEVDLTRIGGALVPSWAPLWSGILADLRRGAAPGSIAARFHRTLIATLAAMATRIAAETGASRAALTGGVMQNALLRDGLAHALNARGLDALTQRIMPANDGGLALGQAAIAAADALGLGETRPL